MNKIIEIKFGSWLYGTNTPDSDLDIKGIYLPTARQIVLGTGKHNISTSRPKQEFERNNKDDIDQEFFSLKEYLKLLTGGQTVALDILFSPESFHIFKGDRYNIFTKIYENRDKLLSKNVAAFYHYALRQCSKYGIKGSRVRAVKEALEFISKFDNYSRLIEFKSELDSFVNQNLEHIKYKDILGPQDKLVTHFEVITRKFPLTNTVKNVKDSLTKTYEAYGKRSIEASNNQNVDLKACSHAVRVNFEAKELLLTGFITFPCPERKLLLDIKTGKMPYKEVEVIIEKGLQDLEEAQKISTLRTEPDYQWAEDFVYDVYSDIVKRGI
jgi:predicted nucleotidyltransferase